MGMATLFSALEISYQNTLSFSPSLLSYISINCSKSNIHSNVLNSFLIAR
jgi:hypothetical protein